MYQLTFSDNPAHEVTVEADKIILVRIVFDAFEDQ